MSRSPLASALLSSVVLHLLGLTVLAVVWDSLRLSPPSSHLIATELVAIPPPLTAPEPVPISVSVPSPGPSPLPPRMAEVVPEPPVVSLPVPLPPTEPPPQVMLRPPLPPVQREIKRVEPLPQPPSSPKPVQARTLQPVQPISRPSTPARIAEAKKAEAPRRGPPSASPDVDAPGGARGHAPGPPAAPQADVPPGPGAGGEAGAGKLFERGDAGVIPGAGSGSGGGGGTAKAGFGTGGEGAGTQVSSRRPGTGEAGGESTGGSADSPARPLAGGYQVKPHYPDSARRRGIEGTTLLKIHVSEQGAVAAALVEQSAGHQDLDQAAIDAVKKWRFEPARRGHQAIAVWVKLPVRFELK